jgi:hypothetical protein
VRDVQIREDFVHLGQGIIEIYVDGLTNQNTQLLRERIDQVRAAGVYVILKPAIAISLEAVIQIEVDARIAAEERLSLENRVALAVEGLVEQLGMGQPLRFSQLTNAVLNVSGVLDLHEFQISAFRDTESFAHGSVTLSRSARIDESVTVPARTVFRTRLGQEFLTTTDTQFPEKQRTIQAEVQAANTGRSGELVRTGAAIAWESQKIGGVTVNVRNEAPLLIDRSNYKSTDRRIAVQILERLVPERIRVASEQKPLRVRVLLRLLAPGDDRDKQRLRIEGAINSFFAGLTPGQPLLKSDLEAQLSKLKPAIGAFELRLLAFPFQSQVPEDDYQVDVSFVEQPVAELIFVYSEPLELAGDMRLVLSLTASDDEKRTAVGAARQAITDYLDGLAPENDADLTVIQAVAAKVAKVLRVEFQPTACSVLNASGQPIPNKIRDRAVSVDAFEKVQLSEASFSIQA